MKYLGIDYGEKRVGIAVSDAEGKVAFPKVVLENSKELIEKIKELCEEFSIAVLNLLIIKQRRFTRKLLKRIELLEEKLEMETGERFREAKTCRETVAELDKKNQELLKSNAGLQQQIDKLSDLLSAYMNEDNAKRISTVNNVGPVQ